MCLKKSTPFQITDLRPEAQLLLCCARTQMEPFYLERLKSLLEQKLDWAYTVSLAQRHGVMPLLYWNLKATSPECVPEKALRQLKTLFQANTRHNLLLAGELVRLLKLFEEHNIPAVPYKGPVLAITVYGNLAFRQFGDLDILIRRRDILNAEELLIAQGYRSQKQLTGAREKSHLRTGCQHEFKKDEGNILVELHWDLMEKQLSFSLDLDCLWRRTKPVALAGAVAPNFAPQDLLLFLCVHGAKPFHRWQRLGWICDVAELLRLYPTLNWQRLITQAGQLNSQRRLFLGLYLVVSLLDIELPAWVQQKIQADALVHSLAAQVREELFYEADRRLAPINRFRFGYRTIEYWPDKLSYARACLRPKLSPNEKDRALMPLPEYLSFFYYLLRPLRLAKWYGWRRLKQLLES